MAAARRAQVSFAGRTLPAVIMWLVVVAALHGPHPAGAADAGRCILAMETYKTIAAPCRVRMQRP